ncbi:MAG: LolA family protein [Polyangiales bacterium]
MRSALVLVGTLGLGLLFGGSAVAQTAPSASASAPVASGSAAPADIAAKIQKAYLSINTYEADFEQQYSMKAFNQVKTSKGHVVFQKPAPSAGPKDGGKMRWDYVEPKDNLVVSDGTTLWSYVASEKQARKMLVKDSQMPTALAFLTGKGDLSKDFNLALADTQNFKGGYVLKATPKQATNLYNFVMFYVDGTTFQVVRVLIVDGQDNRNRFDFKSPKVNGQVASSIFTWSPPTGVTVITN